ncbi:MAG: hypothetical protein HFG26_13265 [Provencibacterium sp.]|jgi:hypothetical protein|nr:hypothetical protein [Provencibacterium sp.]
MLPTVPLGVHAVTRLIIGGNPFSGNSHVSREMDEEMQDYFTTAAVKRTLMRCQECGINTMQLRGDRHILRILREFRAEGGRLQWIAQTTPESASFEANVRQMAQAGPIAIYHHGTVTDQLFKEGETEELLRRLAVLRSTGFPVGLATHMPEVVAYAEEQRWDVDFYMTCVYNLSRIDRVSSAVTGKANEDEPFFESDIPLMYKAIRAVDKPCLAFKILGATRRCQSQETVRAAFEEAFCSIKPQDAVIVGMYPKDCDQVALNCRYTAEAIEKAEAGR